MSEPFLVSVSDDAWRVSNAARGGDRVETLSFDDDAPVADRVAAAKARLSELGWAGAPILLAVPSPWCMCAVIATDDLERAGRRRAMAFRLEEHLPLAAEETIADFVEFGRGEALGVGAELDKVRAILEAMIDAGIEVRHIAPAPMLAAAHAVTQHPDATGVLIGDEASVAFIEVRHGKPVNWYWLGEDREALIDRVTTWETSLEQPGRLVFVDVDRSGADIRKACNGTQCTDLDGASSAQAVAVHAASILAGDASPWPGSRESRDSPPTPSSASSRRRATTCSP